MNRIIILLMCAMTVTACHTVKNNSSVVVTDDLTVPEKTETAAPVTDFHASQTWLLGDIDPRRFTYAPHSEWFIQGLNDYVPDPDEMNRLRKINSDDITITVVLGTWCSDSRREVPHFLKIIGQWNYPEEKIRFIGVDMNKVAPLDDYLLLEIERVPTFIFFRNNIEAGRIIEVPHSSLEKDMVNILESK